MIVHDIYVNVKLQGTLLISVKFCPPSRQVKLSLVLALKTVSFIYLHIFRLVVRIDRKPCGLRGGESSVVAVVPLYRASASVSRKLGVSFLQRIIYIFDNSLEFIQNTQKTIRENGPGAMACLYSASMTDLERQRQRLHHI